MSNQQPQQQQNDGDTTEGSSSPSSVGSSSSPSSVSSDDDRQAISALVAKQQTKKKTLTKKKNPMREALDILKQKEKTGKKVPTATAQPTKSPLQQPEPQPSSSQPAAAPVAITSAQRVQALRQHLAIAQSRNEELRAEAAENEGVFSQILADHMQAHDKAISNQAPDDQKRLLGMLVRKVQESAAFERVERSNNYNMTRRDIEQKMVARSLVKAILIYGPELPESLKNVFDLYLDNINAQFETDKTAMAAAHDQIDFSFSPRRAAAAAHAASLAAAKASTTVTK